MYRFITITIVLAWSVTARGHHSVAGVYDAQKRFIAVVEVQNYELIFPHPLIVARIIDIPDGQTVKGVEAGQTWTLEMDNTRELTALGFDSETFVPGDKIVVALDPARDTSYRENSLYLQALDHQREEFRYIHNLRELFPIGPSDDDLSTQLYRVK